MASLADIVKGIQETNDLLQNSVGAQTRANQLLIDQQRDADAARMDALGATKKTSTKATRPRGFKANFKQSSGLTGLGKALGGAGNFASDVVGAILGKLALPIIIAAGLAFDKYVLEGKGMKAIKTWGKGLISGILDKLDIFNMIPEERLGDVASSLMSAFGVGLLAALISPRLGLLVFFGKLFADYTFDKLFSSETQKDMENTVHAGIKDWFGIEISEASLFKIGAGIAGLFGLGLLRGALSLAFTGGFALFATQGRQKGTGPKLKKGLAGKFRLGFGGRLGLGLMLLSMGEQVGQYISDAMGTDEAIGEVIGNTLNAAAIGFMLAGPYGALILGLGSLAVAGFKAIDKWVRIRRDAVKADLQKELDAAQFLVDNPGFATEEEQHLNKRKLKLAQFRKKENMNREQQLMGSGTYSLAERIADVGTGFRDGVPDFITNKGELYKGINDRFNPYDRDTEETQFRKFQAAAVMNAAGNQFEIEQLLREAKAGGKTDFSNVQTPSQIIDASDKSSDTKITTVLHGGDGIKSYDYTWDWSKTGNAMLGYNPG